MVYRNLVYTGGEEKDKITLNNHQEIELNLMSKSSS